MEIIQTGFGGLFQIVPKIYADHRGWFLEAFKSSAFNKLVGDINFKQDNISFSTKNVVRGLHLQLGVSAQAKLVMVINGRVMDVVVDTRKGSSTFGKAYQIELSSKIGNMLFVPKGFAHGFSALEDSVFFYKCSQEYDPSNESGIIWNDQTLNIDWKVSNPILSEKDRQLPTFNELLAKSVISR